MKIGHTLIIFLILVFFLANNSLIVSSQACYTTGVCAGKTPSTDYTCCGTLCCGPSTNCCTNGCQATCPPRCTPKNCATLGKECGTWGNTCGGTVKCGNQSTATNCNNPLDVCDNGLCCYPQPTACTANDQCCSNNCGAFVESASSTGLIPWGSLVPQICCNSTYFAGPNGNCYKSGTSNVGVVVGISGNDKAAAPLSDGWADCDTSQAIATGACNNICNGWTETGEANLGEYGAKGSFGCCGDDAGEYLADASKVIGTASPKCCPHSTDCVDENNQCVAHGSSSGGKVCGECGWAYPDLYGTGSGCCPQQNMCPVSQYGDPAKVWTDWYTIDWETDNNPLNGPLCVYPNEFLLDKRCESGNSWGSRTRYLSLIMISKGEELGDYVLFCDIYNNSLNYYKQMFDNYQLDVSYLQKNGQCGIYPCLSPYFCVLLDSADNIKAVGGTINPDANGDITNFALLYSILGVEGANCQPSSSNEFRDCGMGLSYDGALGAFIYAREDTTPRGIFGTISDFLSRIFRSLFGAYRSIQISDVKATAELYNYRYPDFNRLYSARVGEKRITALVESFGTTERLMANYTGFTGDMCSQMDFLLNSSKAKCTRIDNGYYLFANRTIGAENMLFDNWREMTSSLRVK